MIPEMSCLYFCSFLFLLLSVERSICLEGRVEDHLPTPLSYHLFCVIIRDVMQKAFELGKTRFKENRQDVPDMKNV